MSTLQAIIYLLGLGYHFAHYLDLLRNNREEADKLGYPWGLVVAAVALLAVLWPLTELARAQHVPTSGRGKERCVSYPKREGPALRKQPDPVDHFKRKGPVQ